MNTRQTRADCADTDCQGGEARSTFVPMHTPQRRVQHCCMCNPSGLPSAEAKGGHSPTEACCLSRRVGELFPASPSASPECRSQRKKSTCGPCFPLVAAVSKSEYCTKRSGDSITPSKRTSSRAKRRHGESNPGLLRDRQGY